MSRFIAIFFALFALLFVASAAPVPGHVELTQTNKRETSGWGTWYHPGLGACGQTNNDNDVVVAISHDIYGSGGNCGQYIQITYNGQTEYAKMVDECQGCDSGDLDMSPAVFQEFAPLSQGKLQNIEWQFMAPGWSP